MLHWEVGLHISDLFCRRSKEIARGLRLKFKDMKKVNEYYQRGAVAGYEIRSVKVIYNPTLNRSFSLALKLLQGSLPRSRLAKLYSLST